MSAPHHHETDTKAAFFGLILGAIVLFGIVYGIVRMTNAKYEHEKPATASANG